MTKLLKRIRFVVKFRKSIPFLKEFFLSKEVQFRKKLISILFIVAYVFFPFDLIPDFLSLLGIVDDVVIAGFILQQIVKLAPTTLKAKYGLLE